MCAQSKPKLPTSRDRDGASVSAHCCSLPSAFFLSVQMQLLVTQALTSTLVVVVNLVQQVTIGA